MRHYLQLFLIHTSWAPIRMYLGKTNYVLIDMPASSTLFGIILAFFSTRIEVLELTNGAFKAYIYVERSSVA